MTLAITIGNTNIKAGYINNKEVVSTSYPKDRFIFNLNGDFDKILISSVVPQLNNEVIIQLKEVTGIARDNITLITTDDIPLDTSLYDTSLVGIDRLLCAYGGKTLYGYPCIIFDLGTAISISMVDLLGRFAGGAILPGVDMGLKALGTTALLPTVTDITPGPVVGRSTLQSISSGAIYGTASIIEGMTKKIETQLGYKSKIIITGGFASKVRPYCDVELNLEENLGLTGLLRLKELK